MARRSPRTIPATPDDQKSKDWMTLEEVLTTIDVPRSTFDDWRRKGEAPPVYRLPNRSLRLKRAEFEKWMNARVVQA